MDWKTFIAQIINTLAWPVVVVFIMLQLKDKLTELIPRLKRIKYKKTEIEFMIEKLTTQEIKIIQYKSDNIKRYQDTLDALVNISSRSALIEAYRLLEVSTSKAILKAFPQQDSITLRKPLQLEILLKYKIITDEEYTQFTDLRAIRNFAVHKEDFNVKREALLAYINTSLSILDKLETYSSS